MFEAEKNFYYTKNGIESNWIYIQVNVFHSMYL